MDRGFPTSGCSTPQVAITGMGIVSCIGCSLDEVSRSLKEGRSGVVLDDERRSLGFRSALVGQIQGFDPRDWGASRKLLRTMDEPARYAFAAARDALADACLGDEDISTDRCGIIFGNDSCMRPAVESVDILRESGGTHFIGAGQIFRSMNSTVTMNLTVALGIRGASWTVSGACASGAQAIGQGLMLIRSGLQDLMIVGGVQETNWQSMVAFDALGVFSTREDAPAEASRPFDATRDGLVPSGGAACLILEELDHARARGANIYGLIRGFGFSSNGRGHLSQPSAEATVRAMQMALGDSGAGRGEIDYINAHATATPVGDLAEAQAIAELFGSKVPVSSTKSMTGHECWMSGASEVVYTALMARDGFLAPNINFSCMEAESPEINVLRETRAARIRKALSNSFGFGGTNAVLVLDFGV